jgi:alginate O-acetyltransferase complex protein AlgI
MWGGLHGAYLAVERMLRGYSGYRPGPFGTAMLGLLTFVLVNIAWVFFRAKTFATAWGVLKGMFGMNASGEPMVAATYIVTTLVIVAGIVGAHWIMRHRTLEAAVAKVHPAILVGALTLMGFAIVIEHGNGNAFIYFQF